MGTVLLLVLAAATAGWVDAVVGGGGLVQLPALLLVPGIAPVQALATNKLAGIAGTSVSAATYLRHAPPGSRPSVRTAVPMALLALAGAAGGAALASSLPGAALEPLVLAALLVVLVVVVARPRLGETTTQRLHGAREVAAAAALGAVLGAYDGLLGPGTGTFLVFALVGVLGLAFLRATATAKVVNVATNLGALLVFAPQGHVVWGLGLLMAAANVLGGYVGARTAVARGSRFVRVVFLVVVSALVLRLGADVLGLA
ncbi:TSUP family transporter [uncultured Pseudokineococcus sp.]|uniref:TSUP family transporter n=1 Tax=uncultured Pseudokineococcus sp. TaxID=1642928 RepID=UPI002637E110|nr:TSUP family transporter [uncultured Pseudokineococcus sp.]